MKPVLSTLTIASAVIMAALSSAQDHFVEERPAVVSREAWGAKAPTHPCKPHIPNRITIHHQGVVSTRDQNAKRRLRNMQAFHQGSHRQFADIAYHFVIDRKGTIYEGRPTTAAGETRTDYDPTGHLLICLLGDFQTQTPTPEQREALVSLVRWTMDAFHLSQETIRGHRDYAHTTCPGKHLYEFIRSDRFKQLLKGKRPPVEDAPGPLVKP
jgi:hypothetical protein